MDRSVQPQLDPSQQQIITAFKAGRSVAILGGAGSGKTFVVNEILKVSGKVAGGSKRVTSCAMSNNAACRIGGCTIHSLFGAPTSWEWSKVHLWERLQHDKKRCDLLRQTTVLVIDEVSLLKRNMIEAIDYAMRRLTSHDTYAALPLGGPQLVASGDPFQLEPPGVDDYSCYSETFFQSRVWFLSYTGYESGRIAVLDHNHRQSKNTAYCNISQRLRYVVATQTDYRKINLSSALTPEPPRNYTRLRLFRDDARNINMERLRELSRDVVRVDANESFNIDVDRSRLMTRLNEVAPKEFFLKKGCIIAIARKSNDITPGTLCKVIDIYKGKDITKTRLRISIYNAAPTCSSPSNSGQSSLVREIQATVFHVYSYDRRVIASRTQLPVLEGYAMTIHRSQGFSVNTMAIDFSALQTWRPNGMVFFALSRCRSIVGLWVKGLSSKHVNVSERARVFMNEVRTIHEHIPERIIGAAALRRYVRGMSARSRAMRQIEQEKKEPNVETGNYFGLENRKKPRGEKRKLACDESRDITKTKKSK